MEQNKQIWLQRSKIIYTGVIIFAVTGILHGIASKINFGSLVNYILLAGIIAGYILYILGLRSFKTILSPNDAKSIERIRMSAFLIVIAWAWLYLGLWVFVSSILKIVAFFYALLGFISLKNSPSFPVKARQGASNLFLSMLLGLIASLVWLLLGWIPFINVVGGLIAWILDLCAFILVFIGWSQIRNADPKTL